jgi:hypothetical protein
VTRKSFRLLESSNARIDVGTHGMCAT